MVESRMLDIELTEELCKVSGFFNDLYNDEQEYHTVSVDIPQHINIKLLKAS